VRTCTGPFSTLELVRPNERAPARWMEYLVDGRPLSRLVPRGDRVGALGWGGREAEARVARQFLGEDAGASGRAPLYVCGVCGDVGCGAVTVRVVRTADSFVWIDFETPDGPGGTSVAGYELHFERTAYLSVFRPWRK